MALPPTALDAATIQLLIARSGQIIDVSPAAVEFYGQPRTALLATTLQALSGAPAPAAWTSTPAALTLAQQSAAGYRLMRAHFAPLRRADEELLEVTLRDAPTVASANDLAALAPTMIALNTPIITFMLNGDGVFTLCEGQPLAALGLRPGELVGQSALERYQSNPALLASTERALRGEAFTVVQTIQGLVFETHYTPLRGPDGALSGVLGTAIDITARIVAEHAMLAQKQLFENLVTVARAVTEHPTLEVTLRNIVDVAKTLTSAEHGSLMIFDEAGALLDNILIRDELMPPDRDGVMSTVLRQGLAGWVLRHRTTALVSDTATDDRWLDFPEARHRVGSALSVPIMRRATLVAILTLSHAERNHFTAEQAQLLEAAAYQIALALDNARLYTSVQQELDERRRAQSEQRKLTALIDASSDLIAITSVQGELLFLNTAGRALCGLSAAEVPGKIWSDLLPPDELAEHRQDIQRQAPTAAGWDGELRIYNSHTGATTEVQASVFMIREADTGQPTAFATVARNITERKQAERELRRERDFTAAVLDTAGSLVIVMDREGRFVRFNRACEQVTGYTFEEVRGQSMWELLLDPTERPAIDETFVHLHEGQFPRYFENHWLTKSGARRLIAWSNTALLDDRGVPEFFISTGIDITEQQAAVAALQASEITLRTLYDITSAQSLTFADKVQALLLLGRQRFDLPVGLLSHIQGQEFEVIAVQGPPDAPRVGEVLPLQNTYCSSTLYVNGPLSISHASASEWGSHPCHQAMEIESYIGTPVLVGGAVYGTLAFTSPIPHPVRFEQSDKELLKLMAQWVGGEIERRQHIEQLRKLRPGDRHEKRGARRGPRPGD